VFTIALIAVLAATVITLCWADNESPGALDNASGVAALIGIAEREREHGDVAFLITDGEELGLAGARAAAKRLPAVFGVINLDGLDDDGTFYVLERFGWPRRGLAPHLALALLSAASALNLAARRRDVPFGVMLDHMPIVNAGTTALTVMRGELSSMRYVHRPADARERLRGAGVSAAVDLVSAALRMLRTQEPARPA
jgi:Zn-dependent M28 family amino/carboxypeptidase